ncbi:hypothetical protein [Mesorhizobium sp. M7D.F.Ca.US.004.01.2.1]|uniref:hypothetical protein n=1 Tax=Mesorhizobium sp. M7D.F.Ca.US.004.01.2.1 TaxID=2496738 RepID=UPI000FC99B72|nr:hypothetical protein [Mesorhizobium sp. M7D.F.Ca.US.004.01.2.1]RUX98036.1 hypothetical protein EN993_00910 [Mesorhizobium sp. M7D.F.Ca.US.004.01.2.1]
MPEGYLFSEGSTLDLARQLPVLAMNELKAMPESVFLSVPMEDVISELVAKFRPDLPTVDEDSVWIDEEERTYQPRGRDRYDIFSDSYGDPEPQRFHVVMYHLPFRGNRDLFRFQPSRASYPGPQAAIMANDLVISLPTAGKSGDQLNAEFGAVVRSIKEHLATAASDLQHVASQIEQPARQFFEARKAELLKGKGLAASLGFPMKRRPDAPTTFIAPQIRRKVVPVRTETVAPFKPEPELDEKEYAHILSVIENMTKVMERSPHTFHDMGEEDIRQHYLVQLNGQYEGQATGETFNHEGKTDILIRSEGRNVFIAECKFWHGEKVFTETVDQLLRYLSWRDTKAALIIFNRNKGLSGVIETANKAIEAHAQYKRGPVVEGDTRFRYVLANPGDVSREIIVTLMFFDVPTAP